MMKSTTTTKKNQSPPSSPPSFSSLPEEISMNCIARIPRSYHPKISAIAKSFKSLLTSTELYKARARLGNIEECLYVCLWDPSRQFPQWFNLWINPNQTKKKKKKKTIKEEKKIGQVLVPIPSSDCVSVSEAAVAIGSEIYVIGGPIDESPSSTVRVLDCRNHTWRDGPSMNVARMNGYTCLYNGKVYVIGGVKDEELAYAEVFDIESQTWECLPDPGVEIRGCLINRIAEREGKISFGTPFHMYAYDTNEGKWEVCDGMMGEFALSECVMENVSYSCGIVNGKSRCCWYDVEDEDWKEVKGLDGLYEKFKRDGDCLCTLTKVVSFGGKLLAVWEEYMMNVAPRIRKKIWCAEIVVEKREGGEIWGKVKWVDVVHTGPETCHFLHCLAVSL